MGTLVICALLALVWLKLERVFALLHLLHARHSVLIAMVYRIERAVMPAPAVRVDFYVLEDGRKRKVKNMFLPVTKKVQLSISPVDSKGNPAQVDGAPKWALTDPSLGSFEVAEDGLSAMLIPAGPIGSAVVQVRADALIGEGEKPIMGELPVDFVAGEAVSLSIAAGEPVDL